MAVLVVVTVSAGDDPKRSEAAPLGRRVVLENGLVLLVAERPGLPMVSGEVFVQAGQLQEPPGKPGLANLTARLLTRGTTDRSALELSEAIEFVGGSLESAGERDTARVSMVVLKRDLALGIDLIADVLQHPAFAPEELRREVMELQGAIQRKQEDPGTVAYERFLATVFGPHAYGRPTEGNIAALAGMTRTDVVQFHQGHYLPNNTIIALSGDVTLAEVQQLVSEKLGGWRARPVTPAAVPPAPTPEGQVVRMDRQHLVQAHVLWGHLGVERRNPDYYSLLVMNYILGGGGFASRLMRSIRDQHGWAYDVRSYFSPGLERGAFLVQLQTKNETAGPAAAEVIQQVRRIHREGVTEEELNDAKAYLTGSFPLRIDTNREVAAILGQAELYDLGLDYPDQYLQAIRSVTREDIHRVARQYLHPDRAVLVVLGNQSQITLPPGN